MSAHISFRGFEVEMVAVWSKRCGASRAEEVKVTCQRKENTIRDEWRLRAESSLKTRQRRRGISGRTLAPHAAAGNNLIDFHVGSGFYLSTRTELQPGMIITSSTHCTIYRRDLDHDLLTSMLSVTCLFVYIRVSPTLSPTWCQNKQQVFSWLLATLYSVPVMPCMNYGRDFQRWSRTGIFHMLTVS